MKIKRQFSLTSLNGRCVVEMSEDSIKFKKKLHFKCFSIENKTLSTKY